MKGFRGRAFCGMLSSALVVALATLVSAAARAKPTIKIVPQIGHSGGVSSVALSPDGRHVLSDSGGTTILLWDAATGALVRTFAGHSEGVLSVAFSPDGRQVLSGSLDKTAKLWDTATGQVVRTFKGHSDGVKSVAFSPNGKQVLTGSFDKTVKLWDAATGALVRTFEGHSDLVTSAAFSPDGRQVLSGSDDYTVKLWDRARGALVRTIRNDFNSVTSVGYAPGGRQVLSGSTDKTVKLWDAATGALVRTFEGHSGWVTSVAFSPDGRQVLSGSWDKTVKLWDAATGQVVRTFEDHSDNVLSVAFSLEGSQVLSGSEDKTVKLWDAATGQVVRDFERGDDGVVASVTFSRDGRKVLSGWDDKVSLWDAATGQLIRTFEGHSDLVTSVAFSPDGQQVVSGSDDTTTRLWKTETGNLLATLLASSDGEWLVLTPEGFFNASSPAAGKLLAIVRGFEVFGIEQFWQALYRPDLVKEKLAGDPDGKVRKAAAKLDLEKVLASGLAPKVIIKSHKAQDRSDSDFVTVSADIAGNEIGKVEWRVNGITVAAVTSAVGKGTQLDESARSQRIALDPGDNVIEVVTYNAAGLVASVPARTTIKWTGKRPTAPPKLHVLALGINEYEVGKLKLKLATADATAISSALSQAGGDKSLFEEVLITRVLDGDVTAANLDKVFADLTTRIRPRDVFVFFAAGHGVTRDARYYFIPQDFRYDTDASIKERAIGQDKWQEWFARIPARKSILMFDTCESGTLTGGTEIAFNTRSGLEQMAAVGRLIQATGRSVLTASTGDQPAREGFRGHGVFTYAVLEALARGDKNGNGLVELTELAGHVNGIVPEITEQKWKVRQVPQMSLQGSDFPLAKQLPSLAPAPGEEIIISTKPTHVVMEAAKIFAAAGGSGAIVQELAPFTLVTLIKTEQGWVLVAKNGTKLGYVAEASLKPVQ